MKKRVAVLGGGNGAHTMAAEMALAGYEVNMFELPKFRDKIEKVLNTKTIQIEGVGRKGEAKLNVVSTKIEDVIRGVDFIMYTLPSFAHKPFAELCARHLEENQTLVLWPGNFGTLEIAKIFREMNVKTKFKLAECSTLPYATRLSGPGQAHLHSYATKVLFSAFPATDTTEIFSQLKDFFPMLQPARNIAEVALSNPNPILHPPATLLNAGRIEYSKGNFHVYVEGITKSVQEVVKAIHREFMMTGGALNVKPMDYEKSDFESSECIMNIAFPTGLRDIQGPFNVHTDRYVTEDVPYGLVPIVQIAELAGIKMPVTRTMITLLSAMNHVDYWRQGRTLGKMGVKDMDLDEFKTYLQIGKRD